jgi:hypothetical protein
VPIAAPDRRWGAGGWTSHIRGVLRRESISYTDHQPPPESLKSDLHPVAFENLPAPSVSIARSAFARSPLREVPHPRILLGVLTHRTRVTYEEFLLGPGQ